MAGGLLLAGAAWTHAWVSEALPLRPRGKARICVIFTGDPQPGDRNWGADAGQIEAMSTRLAEAERNLGNIELVVGTSRSPEIVRLDICAHQTTDWESVIRSARTERGFFAQYLPNLCLDLA